MWLGVDSEKFSLASACFSNAAINLFYNSLLKIPFSCLTEPKCILCLQEMNLLESGELTYIIPWSRYHYIHYKYFNFIDEETKALKG